MQYVQKTLQDRNGNVVGGAVLTITDYPGGSTSNAYATDAVGTNINPITMDSNGQCEFYIVPGAYTYTFVKSGITTKTETNVIVGAASESFLQSGTGAVSRSVQAKERDIVSVFDFMTAAQVTDVTTRANTLDVTTALQTAYDEFAGYYIYHPQGYYRTTGVLNITDDYTRLVGSGSGATIIAMASGTTADQFKFSPAGALATDGTKLAQNGISGMYIHRFTNGTTGAGVHCLQCTGFYMNDVRILDYPEGLKVLGGTLNNFTNFSVFATDNITGAPVAASSLISFKEAALDAGAYQIPYTTTVSNFKVAGTRHIDAQVLITACDGLAFSNGYIGNGYNANVRLKCVTANMYLSGLSFDGVYLDGVVMSGSGTVYGVEIPSDSEATAVVADVGFNNCFFANYQTNAVYATEGFSLLSFNNCRFANTRSWAMDVTGVNTVSNFLVSGCQFKNVGAVTASKGGITASALANCTIVGNQFTSLTATGTQTGIVLAGTSVNGCVENNTFYNCTTEVTNSATWTGKICGVPVTWTPALSFATAGDLSVAYSVQFGEYIRHNNTVKADFLITTSTFTHTTASGSMQISLPLAVKTLSNYGAHCNVLFGGMTKANYTSVSARALSGAGIMTFVASGSGQAAAALAPADMPTGGTVVLRGTMIYEAA